jgi:hypothetical protein
VNDDYRDLKGRLRKLRVFLEDGGHGSASYAQAVSAVRRAERRGDRSRRPTAELMGLLEKAERLGRGLGLT